MFLCASLSLFLDLCLSSSPRSTIVDAPIRVLVIRKRVPRRHDVARWNARWKQVETPERWNRNKGRWVVFRSRGACERRQRWARFLPETNDVWKLFKRFPIFSRNLSSPRHFTHRASSRHLHPRDPATVSVLSISSTRGIDWNSVRAFSEGSTITVGSFSTSRTTRVTVSSASIGPSCLVGRARLLARKLRAISNLKREKCQHNVEN